MQTDTNLLSGRLACVQFKTLMNFDKVHWTSNMISTKSSAGFKSVCTGSFIDNFRALTGIRVTVRLLKM